MHVAIIILLIHTDLKQGSLMYIISFTHFTDGEDELQLGYVLAKDSQLIMTVSAFELKFM